MIGTDPADYGWASRTAMGPQSDGLANIDNAYVRGAHRAYVHRSHSGLIPADPPEKFKFYFPERRVVPLPGNHPPAASGATTDDPPAEADALLQAAAGSWSSFAGNDRRPS